MNKYIKYIVESFFDDIEDEIESDYTDSLREIYMDEVGIMTAFQKHVIILDKEYDVFPRKMTYIKINLRKNSLAKMFTIGTWTGEAADHDKYKVNENILKIDFSQFSTVNIKDMSYMFHNCRNLIELNLTNFDTSNVRDMKYMFYNCKSLKILDLSNFNTRYVTDMSYMFYNCETLTLVNLNSFDTSNVTDMSNMFDGCFNLVSLDLSNFDISNVTIMDRMFAYCPNLKELDLTSFNINDSCNINEIFYMCDNLRYVKCPKVFYKMCKKTMTGRKALKPIFNQINWTIVD